MEVASHAKNFCPESVGKSWQIQANPDKQLKLKLIASMHPAPKDAPSHLIRQIETEAQAIAVSMRACGAKLAYIAASLGKSESYISRIRSGERPVPHWFVEPFCYITGTNLLKQFIAFQTALAEVQRDPSPRERVARLAKLMEAA
jgi:hypothetical protein